MKKGFDFSSLSDVSSVFSNISLVLQSDRCINNIPVKMLWNAVSTFVESRAEVSMKLSVFFSANAFDSSVGTARRCRRSDLLPT